MVELLDCTLRMRQRSRRRLPVSLLEKILKGLIDSNIKL